MRCTTRQCPHDAGSEGGFTLVEVTVALAILMVALLGLVGSGYTALRAAAFARTNAQSADLGNSQIERLRGLPYASVTHSTTDTAMATARGVSGGQFGGEPLETAAGGAVVPHLETVTLGRTTYTVRRYVTRPAVATTTLSGQASVRRLTVVVDWQQRNKIKKRTFSTLITSTRRGLPLPNYRFDYNGTASKSGVRWRIERAPGAQADFGLRLSNLGARDAWEMTATTAGWAYYRDTNANGIWDGLTTEPALTDSNGNGVPDTGLLEPNSPSVFMVASRTTALTETGTQLTDFLATSAAQPAVPAKRVLVALALAGTSGSSPAPTPSASTPSPAPTSSASTVVCTPGTVTRFGAPSATAGVPRETYTNTTLRLFNGSGTIDGDSTTQAVSTMGAAGSLAPGDCNYSTELGSGAGRFTTVTNPARWEYGTTASTDEFRGNALVRLWVQCTSTNPTSLTFTVLSKSTSGIDTVQGSPSVVTLSSGCGPTGFLPVETVVPIEDPNGNGNNNAAFTVAASTSERLVLKVSPDRPVRVLYESPDSVATLIIPAK